MVGDFSHRKTLFIESFEVHQNFNFFGPVNHTSVSMDKRSAGGRAEAGISHLRGTFVWEAALCGIFRASIVINRFW
ncbi:hypothetical protein KP509_26G035300 [Ceratopteris richardii]|nr:hypothetical protein KP509_26G035300 [Ceratopteris richardii]